MQRRAREEGLELSQFDVLRVLWEGDGRAQKYISEVTRITPSATAQVIQKMVALGLVERCEDQNDRRKQLVYLTETSKAMKERLLEKVAEGYDRATRNVSMADRKKYLKINEVLRQNLLEMYENDFDDGS